MFMSESDRVVVSVLLLGNVTHTQYHTGPLFSFDVHEDVRLVNDASVERDEVSF